MEVKSTMLAVSAALLVLAAAGCAQTDPTNSTACDTPTQCDLYSGD